MVFEQRPPVHIHVTDVVVGHDHEHGVEIPGDAGLGHLAHQRRHVLEVIVLDPLGDGIDPFAPGDAGRGVVGIDVSLVAHRGRQQTGKVAAARLQLGHPHARLHTEKGEHLVRLASAVPVALLLGALVAGTGGLDMSGDLVHGRLPIRCFSLQRFMRIE